MKWTETHAPVAISAREDLSYPYEIRFGFHSVQPVKTGISYPVDLQWADIARSDKHVVRNQQERVELYLRVLRREYAHGWFDIQDERFQAATDYEHERDAYIAGGNLVGGGNITPIHMNQPHYIEHGFANEFDLRMARYGATLKQMLTANIHRPAAELLREDPRYQIVNQYYGTFAEQLLQRRHFSLIQVMDPALHPKPPR